MNYYKTIVCDIDGVLADLMPEWLRRYNADFGDTLTPEQLTAWDMKQFVKPECGSAIFNYLHDKTLYDNVKPIPGALSGIVALKDLGYRVVFATAANSQMAGRKEHWLEDHGFLKLWQGFSPDFATIHDKSLLRGGAVMIIDDYPKNLTGFKHSVLFAQKHNETATLSDMTVRLGSWPAIVNYAGILSNVYSQTSELRL